MAEQIGAKDIQFKSQALALVVRAAMTPSTRSGTIKKFEKQLEQIRDERELASLNYALWSLDRNEASYRKTAAKLYRKFHQKSPRYVYRVRYEELTGSHLAPPPPLPDLPVLDLGEPSSLETMLGQVEELAGDPKARKR